MVQTIFHLMYNTGITDCMEVQKSQI